MVAPKHEASRLEELLSHSDRGARLSFAEARELARLYRVHAARLSSARQRGGDPDAVRYLNALCVRAYAVVHETPPRPKRARWFLRRGLSAALGRTAFAQRVAVVLLLCGAVTGGRIVKHDSDALHSLVPTEMYSADALDRLVRSDDAREAFLARRDVPLTAKSLFGASLFANNTRVGMLAFAVGPLLAIPSALLLLYNGITLGAFSAIFVGTRQQLLFLAWIVPHGVPELLAIVLCAAGGLNMGVAVVAPGRDGRTASLRAAASDAFALLLAALPLFLIAAVIESFVRQSLWSTEQRFAVAALVLCALCVVVWGVRFLARRQRAVDTSFLEFRFVGTEVGTDDMRPERRLQQGSRKS